MLEDVVGVAVVCGMCGRFWTPVHVQVSCGCSGEVTSRLQVAHEAGASVQQNKVGGAGLENECVVTV